MKWLNRFDNWIIILLLESGAFVVTYLTGVHFGACVGMVDLKNISIINIVVEFTGLLVTLIFISFVLKKAWREFGTIDNGFTFGIAFASLLSLVITIRSSILFEVTPAYNLIIFIIIFTALIGIGFKIIPSRHRALVTFNNVLERQALGEGFVWIPPFSKVHLFDISPQLLHIDVPMNPSTGFKKLELTFMYQLKANRLHKIIGLKNERNRIKSIINDTIPFALIALNNSISRDELEEKYSNSKFMAVITRLETFKLALSYGTFFPSTINFPGLVENAIWQKKAYKAFEKDFLTKEDYFPKIIVKNGKQSLIYVNTQGNEIGYVEENNLDVCIFDEFERKTLASNGLLIHGTGGIFNQLMELGITPISLAITDIQPIEVLTEEDEKIRQCLIREERALNEKIWEISHTLTKHLEEQGRNNKLDVILASQMLKIANLPYSTLQDKKFLNHFLFFLSRNEQFEGGDE